MSNALPDNRQLFLPGEYFVHEAASLELQLPEVGISHELEIRLKRRLFRLEPNWPGLLQATKSLEIEHAVGLTYGLDPKDDDADPEVEQYPRFDTPWSEGGHPRTNDIELAIHIDPTPSPEEASLKKANIATWMALLIAKDLGEPDGADRLVERFRSDKMKNRVAAWLGHMGVVAGNSAVQAAGVSPTLHALSWLGFGTSLIGNSAYQAHVGGRMRDLKEGPVEAIVSVVDTDYQEEAEELAQSEPDLVDYTIV